MKLNSDGKFATYNLHGWSRKYWLSKSEKKSEGMQTLLKICDMQIAIKIK